MNRRFIFTVLTSTLLILITIFACEKKPTAPVRENPFDPKNVQTQGDPFKLTAKIANGGILLEWTRPQINNLKSFNIYRSEQENSGYSKIKNIPANTNQFTDTDIQNGHSYWYVVTAINAKGKESTRTDIAPVNIKTQPVLVINGGAQYTPSRQVNLTILANTATQMILSNNADFSGAQWEAYTTSKTWILPDGEGEKIVYLKVKYNDGKESRTVNKKIIFDTTPPIAVLAITPDNGITNETSFKFDPTASSDNLTSKNDLRVRYDYENDGTFDTDWEELRIKNYEFQIGGGDKTVKMQLKDGAGWQVETKVNVFVNTRPQAQFAANQTSYFPLIMHFDASASSDYEDGHNLYYRWDFDGDGTWDTDWLTQDTISHEYTNAGSYMVKLDVKDWDRLTGGKENSITVQPPLVEMVYVAGGTFTMGDTWGDGGSDERPTHTVTVNSFYMGKYEVTQAQYQEIMGTNPSYFKGDNRPVEQVTWYDAIEFCNKLSEREGLESCYTINGSDVTCDFSKNGYRLPTEAEWEYAARGGNQSQGYKYSGSDNVDEVAWYRNNSDGLTHEVGTKNPNELGIYDMSGNVWEWCWDWYSSSYYSSSPQDNPKGPDTDSKRVLRGGTWGDTAGDVRVAVRYSSVPSYSTKYRGFRLLRTY